MEKATRYSPNESRRGRGQPPRLALWLALLFALLVAALGAALTQTAPAKSATLHRAA
jgi:hypothetical protein